MRGRLVVGGIVGVIGLAVTGILYHYFPDRSILAAGFVGTIILAFAPPLLEWKLSASHASRKEARERHRNDLVTEILEPWKRQLEAMRLRISNNFGAVVGVDHAPVSTFTVQLEYDPMPITSGFPALHESVLWDKIPSHWAPLGVAHSQVQRIQSKLGYDIRRFLESIETALPADSTSFRWSRWSGTDPNYGRKMFTTELWKLMLQWSQAGTRNRPLLRPATVREQAPDRFIVDLGEGNGFGSGAEANAEAACAAVNDATDSPVNRRLLLDMLHGRDEFATKLSEVAKLIDEAVFNPQLRGKCSICKTF